MSEKTVHYITTTLPYVNADPHIGFAYEVIAADALARYWRLLGHEVFFNTGTDEHGQKIAEKADEVGQERQAYVDHFANEFQKLGTALDLSFDRFIRTTDSEHKKAAATIWERCAAAGDIYKKKYRGLYCVGCELFYKPEELESGTNCPVHHKPAVEVEEENYFFALSKYQSYLEEYLSNPTVVVPDWQRQWALEFVKKGLEDFSISRERSRLDWGVPVPGDDNQVMYVWFDALTNYISTLNWPESGGAFEKFWVEGHTLQLAGKDQVRFQSIMWQAMLKSAGVPATDQVWYHGFINSGGQKMSKSIGNVISPYNLVHKYGTDATRYLLLRHVHPFEDTDITFERLDEWYTANLANGLGNLTARIMKMAEDNLAHPVELPTATTTPPKYADAIATYNLQSGMDIIWKQIGAIDERITREQPFKLVKEDAERGKTIIAELVVELHQISQLLQPFLPATSRHISDAIRANQKPATLFARLEK